MNKRQMNLNLLFTCISFMISLSLNFYITPIISRELGDAAYGFVSMANDFVSYAAIISSVLNSVAGRFIAIEMHVNNVKKANLYYSSVFIANIILAILLFVAGTVFIVDIEYILDVPPILSADVKATFFITFFNYVIVLISSVFTVCTYITNRLDIAGIRNSISYVIKFALIILLFKLVHIRMYYIAVATVISSIFLAIANIRLTRKMVPELELDIKSFKFSYVKLLALSGIWMAISNLSQVLMTGLDSIITNKMIGAAEMGLLSIAKTIPNAIILAISTLGVIFTPNFVELYAKNAKMQLVLACKQSMKVMTLTLGVPIIGIIIFGRSFYTLWLPYKTPIEVDIVYFLSVLMMIQSVFNMMTISIAQLSVVTNKLKPPVFVSFFLGVINMIIVIFLIKYTNLGLYAVAGVSSVLFAIRYLVFNPVYAAYVLKINWRTFYYDIIKLLIPLIILGVIYWQINKFIHVQTWRSFLGLMSVLGLLGYIVMFIFIEHSKFINIFTKRGRKHATKN